MEIFDGIKKALRIEVIFFFENSCPVFLLTYRKDILSLLNKVER